MTHPTRIAPTVCVSIYAVVRGGTEHSQDPEICYIGQTDGRIETRLSQHIADAKSGRMTNIRFSQWILSEMKYKRRPSVMLIEECSSYVSADLSEKFHIERCAKLYRLFNLMHNAGHSQSRQFTEAQIRRVI